MIQTKKQYVPSEQFREVWGMIQRGEIKAPRARAGFWVNDVMIYPPINQPDKKKKTKIR